MEDIIRHLFHVFRCSFSSGVLVIVDVRDRHVVEGGGIVAGVK